MHPVYFVRHGESEWNVADRICGQTDVALTDLGHAQAIATGQKTARHISEMTGVPMRMEPRLVEQNFGKWEGTSPRNAADFFEAKKQFVCRHEGGESMLQLAQRIYNLLDELGKEADKTYMLVAHNGIARVVCSYFHDMTNEEYASYGVKNCSLTRFDFD